MSVRAVDPTVLSRLRGEVRTFLESYDVPCHVDAWMTQHSPAFSKLLGERGWIGMTVPRGYGGGAHSFTERHVVIEELLAAGAPIAAHWFADRQVAPAILHHGSHELRQRYLPAIVRGECFFAIGLSEHGAGSDLASVRTSAQRVDGGWRVSGAKVWTSWAHKAHALLALVRTSDERYDGLTQMIIPLPAEGVTIQPIRSFSGRHHFNEVLFEDVWVPDELILGKVGRGWQQVMNELRFERSGPERFLSTFPLLADVHGNAESAVAPAVAALASRLWCLRQASRSVADHVTVTGDVPVLAATLVKDLGTRFEQESLETLLSVMDAEPDPSSSEPFKRSIAHAVQESPGFTLRGGSTEILRGIIARESLS